MSYHVMKITNTKIFSWPNIEVILSAYPYSNIEAIYAENEHKAVSQYEER